MHICNKHNKLIIPFIFFQCPNILQNVCSYYVFHFIVHSAKKADKYHIPKKQLIIIRDNIIITIYFTH